MLTEALNDPNTNAEATALIRGLLSEIRLVPDGKALAIELAGELAGLLKLATPQRQTPPAGAKGCSRAMVAGVGFEPTTFRL